VPDALTFSSRLLDEQGVAVVAGEGFGCPGFIRISFARSRDELSRGLVALADFVETLDVGPGPRSRRAAPQKSRPRS
jgi:aspartate/methionine/tyrosine aminotransferase